MLRAVTRCREEPPACPGSRRPRPPLAARGHRQRPGALGECVRPLVERGPDRRRACSRAGPPRAAPPARRWTGSGRRSGWDSRRGLGRCCLPRVRGAGRLGGCCAPRRSVWRAAGRFPAPANSYCQRAGQGRPCGFPAPLRVAAPKPTFPSVLCRAGAVRSRASCGAAGLILQLAGKRGANVGDIATARLVQGALDTANARVSLSGQLLA